ncbi:hypothetical protein B0H65DRAFT_52567 [Neurospora tetraspora]|uniref:Uncharacterized protein n=1 Tax=Neurospora tetraspora TaxID=94610 RepID=A0AAE0JPX6_9PEZI|nr:hypothetical protein B0H65DRAFT_52567 [Neurospora tetraspora]
MPIDGIHERRQQRNGVFETSPINNASIPPLSSPVACFRLSSSSVLSQSSTECFKALEVALPSCLFHRRTLRPGRKRAGQGQGSWEQASLRCTQPLRLSQCIGIEMKPNPEKPKSRISYKTDMNPEEVDNMEVFSGLHLDDMPGELCRWLTSMPSPWGCIDWIRQGLTAPLRGVSGVGRQGSRGWPPDVHSALFPTHSTHHQGSPLGELPLSQSSPEHHTRCETRRFSSWCGLFRIHGMDAHGLLDSVAVWIWECPMRVPLPPLRNREKLGISSLFSFFIPPSVCLLRTAEQG